MTISSIKQTTFGTYSLDFYDDFVADQLDLTKWIPYYLPQWSNRIAAMPCYSIHDSRLILQIEQHQQPWCPEFNGDVRVSSLQTGLFAGALGSAVGQHRFAPACVVREVQPTTKLYTPMFGYIEMRAKCSIAPNNVAALWMIGFEEQPDQSAEICIFELKGTNVGPNSAIIGYGVHPFGDPTIHDEFYEDEFAINIHDFNVYAAEWTPIAIHFYVNHRLIRTIQQSPEYAMQLMLNIYDLENRNAKPMEFHVDYVAGYGMFAN